MTDDYVIRMLDSPHDVDAGEWDRLLDVQGSCGPFMRHAYLAALHDSGCAAASTGWIPHLLTLWRDGLLVAACVVYEKSHSYGEYVFDWAWANAYAQHGLAYYPKAVVSVPFTPVPGPRLLATHATHRVALVRTLVQWCEARGLSSLHLLFANQADIDACAAAGLMLRHTVQFHWKNEAPGYADFDDFLMSLTQEKRKKIRQERRKVAQAGVSFRWSQGRDITQTDWDFFYCCYERTYLEHGNAPYLSRDFFQRMADTMPEHWLLFTAERSGHPIATSLIALDACSTTASRQNTSGDCAAVCCAQVKEEPAQRVGDTEQNTLPPRLPQAKVAYGRYWGALERVDCLHFEACYYQPLQWCIDHGYHRFEGGAQGEHKMARALLPVRTTSAHWLAHPSFADAVARFLEREEQGVSNYLEDLSQRNPIRNET
jgi:predicted N-acyltransferase